MNDTCIYLQAQNDRDEGDLGADRLLQVYDSIPFRVRYSIHYHIQLHMRRYALMYLRTEFVVGRRGR